MRPQKFSQDIVINFSGHGSYLYDIIYDLCGSSAPWSFTGLCMVFRIFYFQIGLQLLMLGPLLIKYRIKNYRSLHRYYFRALSVESAAFKEELCQ